MKTPAEPYGIALSPDRKTVMVTTIADRTLVAFDTANGKEKWRTALGREPRGIAVSPDGTRALVAYLTTGTVDQIDLLESHKAEHIALSTQNVAARPVSRGKRRRFARGAFTALFMGEQQAVVPFQRETPVQQIGGRRAHRQLRRWLRAADHASARVPRHQQGAHALRSPRTIVAASAARARVGLGARRALRRGPRQRLDHPAQERVAGRHRRGRLGVARQGQGSLRSRRPCGRRRRQRARVVLVLAQRPARRARRRQGQARDAAAKTRSRARRSSRRR